MIALVELHINYLVSEKVFRFSVFIISLSVFYLLYASGVHEANTMLLYYSQQYQKEFTIEMVNFGKLLSMIYLLFIMIVGYVIHQYDVIILNRSPLYPFLSEEAPVYSRKIESCQCCL